jgi:hypothetical protein
MQDPETLALLADAIKSAASVASPKRRALTTRSSPRKHSIPSVAGQALELESAQELRVGGDDDGAR